MANSPWRRVSALHTVCEFESHAAQQDGRTSILEAEDGAAQGCRAHRDEAREAHRKLMNTFAADEYANHFRHAGYSV